MRARTVFLAGLCAYVTALVSSPMSAQRAGAFRGSLNDPAIKYSTAPLNNVVADVNKKIQDGTVRLTFEGRGGFLRSALEALQLPLDSQLLVFSRASLQGKLISEQSPRAVYFDNRVALGWVRDGSLIEVAAHDDTAGVVFYTLEQRADGEGPPQFKRAFECLGCHQAGDTLGVPGFLMFTSVPPTPPQGFATTRFIDQSVPLDRRFGGWYVTGTAGMAPHLGNRVPALDGRPSRALNTVQGLFNGDGYPAMSSDIVAHLVFTHQVGMTNLLTRAAWEARVADPALHPPYTAAPGEEERIALMMKAVATEVVDHLLFVDEAPLPDRVRGQSGFAERFSASGPRDRLGRSLTELDLTRRVMKYPCSFLIYSPAFDVLPERAKSAIYQRLWDVLSGSERDTRYQSLVRADRQAIVDILRDTKKDLPAYFSGAVR